MRVLFSALGVALFLLRPSLARADECLDAYDGSQRARRAGQLVEAQRQLLSCAQVSCPDAVSKECTRWLREVNDALPTLVIGVRDAKGHDLSNVRVTEGDRVLAERLDGRAIELDPGEHRLRLELGGGRSLDRRVVVRQGEKNRLLQIQLDAPKPKAKSKPSPTLAAARPEPGIPTLAIVLGGVGIAALGSFAYFALDAQSDVDDLERRCKPTCDQSKVDRAARKALVADISLGVGVVALGAAGWVVVARPEPARGSWLPRGAVLGFGARR